MNIVIDSDARYGKDLHDLYQYGILADAGLCIHEVNMHKLSGIYCIYIIYMLNEYVSIRSIKIWKTICFLFEVHKSEVLNRISLVEV